MIDTFLHVLSAAASIALISGVIIAIMQLRHQARIRQEDVAMRLYATFGEESFVRHYQRVSRWGYATYADYRDKGTADDATSLMVVSVFFESMGLLLKRGLAPIDLLDDLLSGPVLEAWPKVRPIWVGLREDHNQPSWAEWFEFLHDEMARRMAQLNRDRL
ncbi:MAG TPA: hypothetical protein VGH04_15850 [Gemmatimonadaceae bacterium]